MKRVISLYIILAVLLFLGCRNKSEKEKISELGWDDYNVEINQSTTNNSVDSVFFFRTKRAWELGDGTMSYSEFTVIVKDFESEEFARNEFAKLLYDKKYQYVCLLVNKIYLYDNHSGLSRNENLKRIDELREMIHNINPYITTNGDRTFYSERIYY